MPLWYQRISIYVFASRVEGFGLTMLEAMAAGDAVVATRAGAAEMVIADGDDGVLAPVDDSTRSSPRSSRSCAIPNASRRWESGRAAGVVTAFSRDREADEISAVSGRSGLLGSLRAQPRPSSRRGRKRRIGRE